MGVMMAPRIKRVFVMLAVLSPVVAVGLAKHPMWVLYWIFGVCSAGLAVGVVMGIRAVFKKQRTWTDKRAISGVSPHES
jgi:hypothetical protein